MALGVISSVIIFIFSIIGAVFMNERIYNLFVKYAEVNSLTFIVLGIGKINTVVTLYFQEYSKDAARIRYDGKVQESKYYPIVEHSK